MDINQNRQFTSASQENVKISDIENVIRKGIGEKVRIESIETSKYGDINSCYMICVSHPTNKLFLKVENHDLIPEFYSSQIEREQAGINLMKRYGVSCPNIVSCDISKNDIGKKYIMTEFVGGHLLSELWDAFTPIEKINTKNTVNMLIDSFVKMKSTHFGDIFNGGNRGIYENWKDAYLNIAKILLDDCINAGLLENDEQELIKSALLKSYVNANNNYIPCFNHMDIHWQNLIANVVSDRITINAVLDFGNSMFGVPYTDEYRLQRYGYFTEDFFGSNATKYDVDKDELFTCQILFDLEVLIFRHLMNKSLGVKSRIKARCEQYIEGIS